MRLSKIHLSSDLDCSGKELHKMLSPSCLAFPKGRTPKSLAQSQRINSEELRTRRNSKSIHRSQEKDAKSKKRSGELDEIYKELLGLKEEYKSLKDSYNLVIREKVESKKREARLQEEIARLGRESDEKQKRIERCDSQLEFYAREIERIKKESMKLLQIEGFKLQKLEENLAEKESMILYLTNRAGPELKEGSSVLNCTNPFGSQLALQSPKSTLLFNDLQQGFESQSVSRCSNSETIRERSENASLVEDEKETRRRDESEDDEEVELLYNKSQNLNFRKNKDLQTLLGCKSPAEKKKRSVTGSKTVTAVKKKETIKAIKGKKLPN